jgi:hypothetical protein
LANLIGVSEEVLRGTSSALPTRSHTKPNNALIEPNLIAQKARVVAQSSISGAEQQNFLDNSATAVVADDDVAGHPLPFSLFPFPSFLKYL